MTDLMDRINGQLAEIRIDDRAPDEPPPETIKAEAERRNGIFMPTTAMGLIDAHPCRRPFVIDGLCRRGETKNLIGSTKVGKSWLLLGMLLSVASGRDWMGFQTAMGRVLLIDNELHPDQIAYRIKTVAAAMQIPDEVLRDSVDIISLRGRLVDIHKLGLTIDALTDRGYSLIALDAFYRTLPEGVSENDNAAMAQIYNRIDSYSSQLDCAVVLNHHSTKGDQSAKSTTDVGSGAGSISRAADVHLIIRPHELESCAVMEAVCRSFAPVQPRTIRWEWPLWHGSEIDPEIKRPKSTHQQDMEKQDRETDAELLEVLDPRKGLTRYQVRTRTEYGQTRVDRGLARIVKAGKAKQKHVKRKGQRTEVYVRCED